MIKLEGEQTLEMCGNIQLKLLIFSFLSKTLKINIYTTIVLLDVLYIVKHVLLIWGKNISYKCLKMKYWRHYLDLWTMM